MRVLFSWLILASTIMLIVSVLLQQRGAGLGAAFGGDSGLYRSRRGVEKILFQITIVAAIIFVLSVVLAILSR